MGRRVRFACLVLLGALGLLAPAVGRAENPTLTAEVGPGFAISLKDAAGSPVTRLDPGTYTIAVHDRSDIHDFHLSGPGVEESTDVELVGDETWTVTFQDGTYRFLCDPHADVLKGSFTVGAPTPTPTPTPAPARVPGRLTGTIGPGAVIALRAAAGGPVRTLLAGVYSVVVRDLSKRDNFHLVGPGLDRKTPVAGTGTSTWKVELAAGVYRYRSDAHPRLAGSFSVKAAPAAEG